MLLAEFDGAPRYGSGYHWTHGLGEILPLDRLVVQQRDQIKQLDSSGIWEYVDKNNAAIDASDRARALPDSPEKSEFIKSLASSELQINNVSMRLTGRAVSQQFINRPFIGSWSVPMETSSLLKEYNLKADAYIDMVNREITNVLAKVQARKDLEAAVSARETAKTQTEQKKFVEQGLTIQKQIKSLTTPRLFGIPIAYVLAGAAGLGILFFVFRRRS